MPPITDAVFKTESKKPKPLLIGCSGDGGHNAAIAGIKNYLDAEFSNEQAIDWPSYPREEDNQTFHVYVDLLLDAVKLGTSKTAQSNVFQRFDETKELNKLIQLQATNEQFDHEHVKQHFLTLLNQAWKEETPYTELISTQAMSLGALCDAILDYNQETTDKRLDRPKLVLHQYLTDLPTKGAVHFFNPLNKLSDQQCEVVKLYAVGNQNTLEKNMPNELKKKPFQAIHNIDPTQNPMVRGFFKEENNHCNDWTKDHDIVIEIGDGKKKNVTVPTKNPTGQNNKVATIMLGSQAGAASTTYAAALAQQDYDQIFVFASGQREDIQKNLAKQRLTPKQLEKITVLGPQSGACMPQLMTRSNLAILSGGGLSVMEQLALPHKAKQSILFHHKEPKDKKQALASGISWEDANVDHTIEALRENNYAQKITPKRLTATLRAAELHQHFDNQFLKDRTINSKLEHLSQNSITYKTFKQFCEQHKDEKQQLFAVVWLDQHLNEQEAEQNATSWPEIAAKILILTAAFILLAGAATFVAVAISLAISLFTELALPFAAILASIVPMALAATLGALTSILIINIAAYGLIETTEWIHQKIHSSLNYINKHTQSLSMQLESALELESQVKESNRQAIDALLKSGTGHFHLSDALMKAYSEGTLTPEQLQVTTQALPKKEEEDKASAAEVRILKEGEALPSVKQQGQKTLPPQTPITQITLIDEEPTENPSPKS